MREQTKIRLAGCLVCMVATALWSPTLQADRTFEILTPGPHVLGLNTTIAPHPDITTASAVGFDPTNPDRLFVTQDANAGGLYSASISSATVGDKIVDLLLPSDLVVDRYGDVYITFDFSPPHVAKISDPMGGPYRTDLSGNYLGAGDDDPVAIDLIPAGFVHPTLSPGDIVLGDRGIDDNPWDGLVGLKPGSAAELLWKETTSSTIGTLDVMASSPVDGRIYFADQVSTKSGVTTLFFIDSELALKTLNVLLPTGEALANVENMAVHPLDGSIWVADDGSDHIFRIDPATGIASLEITMEWDGIDPFTGANFAEAGGMAFSPDGSMLAVIDTQYDEIHIFSIPEPATALLMILALAVIRRR